MAEMYQPPMNADKIFNFSGGEMLEKRAATNLPIHELLTRRWSPRAYDAKRPVTREQLNVLLEAARRAVLRGGLGPAGHARVKRDR